MFMLCGHTLLSLGTGPGRPLWRSHSLASGDSTAGAPGSGITGCHLRPSVPAPSSENRNSSTTSLCHCEDLRGQHPGRASEGAWCTASAQRVPALPCFLPLHWFLSVFLKTQLLTSLLRIRPQLPCFLAFPPSEARDPLLLHWEPLFTYRWAPSPNGGRSI